MALTRGMRNNNFGNIGDSPFARSIPGYTGSDGRFAQFDSPEAGLRAQSRLLDIYQSKHGLNTVQGIVNRWSPPNENDTGVLVNSMAQRMGVGPGDPLNLSDPSVKAKLIHGIIQQENGTTPYTPEQITTVLGQPGTPAQAPVAGQPPAAPVAAPPLPPPIEVATIGAPSGLLASAAPAAGADPAAPEADPYAAMMKGLLAPTQSAQRPQDPFANDPQSAGLLSQRTAAPQFRGIQPMTRTRRFA